MTLYCYKTILVIHTVVCYETTQCIIIKYETVLER